MLAAAADSSRERYFSSVTRVTKLSAGIQFAPFMKTGAPLTTTVKLLPPASCAVHHLQRAQPDARLPRARASRRPTASAVSSV